MKETKMFTGNFNNEVDVAFFQKSFFSSYSAFPIFYCSLIFSSKARHIFVSFEVKSEKENS